MPRKSWRLIKRSRQETSQPEPTCYPLWSLTRIHLDGVDVPIETALARLVSLEYGRTLFGVDWYGIDLWWEDGEIGLSLVNFTTWERLVNERYANIPAALTRVKEITHNLESFVMEALL